MCHINCGDVSTVREALKRPSTVPVRRSEEGAKFGVMGIGRAKTVHCPLSTRLSPKGPSVGEPAALEALINYGLEEGTPVI